MKKNLLIQILSLAVFLGIVPAIYFFWDNGAANQLIEAVHPPTTVNPIRLGTRAPDFFAPANRVWSQKEFRFSQLKGYPVILHFWATWCGPCLTELPELLQLSDRLRPQGFSIVAVAVDESWAVLEQFFQKHPDLKSMQNRMVLILDPRSEIANAFGSNRFPESFLIKRDQVIDNKFTGAQPWNDPVMLPFLENIKLEK
jgi:thiol-disulfide isomerase/thioredoxin